MNKKWYSRDELFTEVNKIVIPTKIVLDVGAGIYPQHFFTPDIHIIVEPFLPYLKKLAETDAYPINKIFLNSDWFTAMKLLPEKTVDTVFGIDVIEHFNKDDGYHFLAEAERVARCQIIIFTPLGMYPQSYQENDLDRWGMHGSMWQSHKSGWMPEDFIGDGWEFLICKDFQPVDQYELPLQEPFGAFWAIKTLETKYLFFSPMKDRLLASESGNEKLANYAYNNLGETLLPKYRYRTLVKYLLQNAIRVLFSKIKVLFSSD